MKKVSNTIYGVVMRNCTLGNLRACHLSVYKKVSKPNLRFSGKVGLLSLLMFLQAILANAKEGIIIRQTYNEASGITSVLVDTDNNGFPDMNLYIPFTDTNTGWAFIRDTLSPGLRVEVDDDFILPEKAMGMDVVPVTGLLKINGVDVLDIFPGFIIFDAAERARAAQQQGGR